MYLKALELTGFKSFAQKTVVEFNRGITSIVGPNGSGKSNILDAILWVLGEQSYKNIRAKESSDVIFSGGKNKKPRSMAEVSLIVDNEDRYLDIEFSEVKITRRIYKGGENEYLINNRKVRLKDINNLFMDTGIGKQAYSIIGQGRVERIISSSPKELREIIEEAAGVKRAKLEKEDSIKKLKEVKNEVEKIEFVEKELAERVSHLREEERKARLFKTFSEKIDAQRFMILEYNIDEEKKYTEEYEDKMLQLQKLLDEVEEEYTANQKELDKSIRESEEKYNLLETEKEKNIGVMKDIEKLKEEHTAISGLLSNLDIQSEEKEKRSKVLEKEILGKEELLKNSEGELSQMEKELSEKKEKRDKARLKVEGIKSRRDSLLQELNGLLQKNRDLEVDKIKVYGENEDLEKRISTAEVTMKRQIREKEALLEEFNKYSDGKAEFEENKSLKEKEKSEFEILVTGIKGGIEKLAERLSIINKEKMELRYRFETLDAKKRANENIIERNETFARAIKYILNENIKGVIGAFINLIDIPEGYEEAIQTLSGGYFQDIVVENVDVGKRCIALLKEKQLGRGSFLPIDKIKVYNQKTNLPEEKGIIGFATDIVKYDAKIQKVISFVFGNSLVVENMETGTSLLKKGFNGRIVTLEGDIISAGGRMTGGSKNKGRDELLERKKELGKIRSEMDKLSLEGKKYDEKINELQKRMTEGEKKEKEVLVQLDIFVKGYKEFITKYEDFTSEYNKIRRELDTFEYEITQNKEFIHSRREKIKENNKISENIEKYIVENNLKIQEINNELENIDSLEEYQKILNTLDKDYEILKVRTENNKSRYSEIKMDYDKLFTEKTELEEFEKDKTILKGKYMEKISVKSEEIGKKSEEIQQILDTIRTLELKIKELDKVEKELIKTVKDIEIRKRDMKNEYGKIEEKLSTNRQKMEGYLLEMEDIDSDRVKESPEYAKISSDTELQAIKRKLSLNEKSRIDIGSVNLSTIEEYKRENIRYTNLVNQKKDLIASRESLFTLIKDIEGEIIEKFDFAFREINKNFKYMCESILNGAKGSVKLMEEENLLETGLELSVKYKNKPEQTLMLLSGGEKSMLAVSFIMAIFMFKPSPFTFFDEIEAALDEENTKKIVGLLNEFISKSQFILITHNKETMKGSHRLYGVTMNKEIGESRLISVDV